MQRIFFLSTLLKRITLGLAFYLALSLHPGIAIYAQSDQAQGAQRWDEWDVIPGSVIVKYKSEKSARLKEATATSNVRGLALTPIEASVEKLVRAESPTRKFLSILPDTFVGKFDPRQRDEVIRALAADPDVIYFEPDRIRVIGTTWGTQTPNDPGRAQLWGMDRIGAPAAWARQPATRSAIRVAVMEDRYDATHRDLTAQNSPVQNNMGPITDHATHVSGIIAATGNNNTDVVGVANVELVSLAWPSSISMMAQQITWARNNQIRVINMSWGYCGNDGVDNGDDCKKCLYIASSKAEQEAITNARGDIVFVAAAGNGACQTDANGRTPIPASYNDVIGVSALSPLSFKITEQSLTSLKTEGVPDDVLAKLESIKGLKVNGKGQFLAWLRTTIGDEPTARFESLILKHALDQSEGRAAFSNFGPYVDLTAPGVDILSTITGNATKLDSGTSMASPHVAGSAAAVLAIAPAFDIPSIPRLLTLTAEDIGAAGRDNDFGEGVVRVDRAVAAIANVYAENGASCGAGTLANPYCTLRDAINLVPAGGTIGLVRGEFSVPTTITKPLTIVSVGGSATIR
jgi:subtilisin family serine protease